MHTYIFSNNNFKKKGHELEREWGHKRSWRERQESEWYKYSSHV